MIMQLLKEIAIISAGQGAPQGDKNYCDNGTPFVKAGNLLELIEDNSIDNIQKVSYDVAKSHKLKLYPKGTVLFAKSGMSCLKGYVYVLPCDAYVVSHLACITPKIDISQYLKYYFDYNKPNKLVKDPAYPSISLSDIGDLKIKLKDENERNNIVSSLSKIEEIISLRKRQLQQLDELVKARFVELFSHNVDKVPMNSMCVVSGGYSFKSSDITGDGNIKILQIGNVYLNDVNWDTINYLPEGYDKTYSKFLLNENDIVVALTRPIIQSLGNVKACLVKNSDLPCLLNQRVGRIVPRDDTNVCIKFVYGCLMTDDFTRYVESCCTGCSQPNISTKDLDNYMIPNATYEQQIEFVNFKEQVDKSKSVVQKALDEAQTLFDSLMQKYFG